MYNYTIITQSINSLNDCVNIDRAMSKSNQVYILRSELPPYLTVGYFHVSFTLEIQHSSFNTSNTKGSNKKESAF